MAFEDRTVRTPLWAMDGARYGRVDVRLTPDGGLEVRRHEMGAGDRAAWGDDDHEAVLEVAPRDVAQFALAMIKEAYAGRRDALEALLDLCEDHGVDVRHAVWT
jgi:hypothetical protein